MLLRSDVHNVMRGATHPRLPRTTQTVSLSVASQGDLHQQAHQVAPIPQMGAHLYRGVCGSWTTVFLDRGFHPESWLNHAEPVCVFQSVSSQLPAATAALPLPFLLLP